MLGLFLFKAATYLHELCLFMMIILLLLQWKYSGIKKWMGLSGFRHKIAVYVKHVDTGLKVVVGGKVGDWIWGRMHLCWKELTQKVQIGHQHSKDVGGCGTGDQLEYDSMKPFLSFVDICVSWMQNKKQNEWSVLTVWCRAFIIHSRFVHTPNICISETV